MIMALGGYSLYFIVKLMPNQDRADVGGWGGFFLCATVVAVAAFIYWDGD